MGCEDCDCFLGGTVGGIAVCGTNNGQCKCKPKVGSRQCAVCKDGAYELDSNDLFGCKGKATFFYSFLKTSENRTFKN